MKKSSEIKEYFASLNNERQVSLNKIRDVITEVLKEPLETMKYSLFVIILLFIFSCSGQKEDPSVLIKTDSAFSRMASDSGMKKAFTYYAGDEAIKLTMDRMPIIGKNSIGSSFTEKDRGLEWEPLRAKISESGDMGWTFGKWRFILRSGDFTDTVSRGVYVTFWEKQEDGSWKYVIDGGNITPEDFK